MSGAETLSFNHQSSALGLKEAILRAWQKARNEHERGLVLGEIAAARHEIRISYMAHRPALRAAIAEMEETLETIMRGKYTVAAPNPLTPEPRSVPLAAHAGYIGALLLLEADSQDRLLCELHGGFTCEARKHDALDAHKAAFQHHARPAGMNTATGYVYPPDPLSVECKIHGAAVGTTCAGRTCKEGK